MYFFANKWLDKLEFLYYDTFNSQFNENHFRIAEIEKYSNAKKLKHK